ncbi:MAG: hypothetical protein JKY60_20620 [Kordiimonadaceae bacterium]|nr:hypothetical protein [Kordiimonadaceae bacterium]
MPDDSFNLNVKQILVENGWMTPEGLPELTESIDINADSILTKYSGEPLPFNPLHVGDLLLSIGDHLSNCRSIRSEAHALANTAISLIHNQGLAEDLRINEQLIDRISREYFSATVGNSQSTSSKEGVVEPTIEASDARNDFNKQINELRENVTKSISRYNKEIRTRVNTDGSGGNYVQKYAALASEFNVELIECYRRARCVVDGLKKVYKEVKFPVPTLSRTGYLDQLIIWYKNVLYTFDRKASKIENFSWHLSGFNNEILGPDKPTLYKNEQEFSTHRDARNFRFTIKKTVHLAGIPYDHFALRAVDIRILQGSTSPLNTTGKEAAAFFAGTLKIPEQETSENRRIPIPQIVFDKIEAIGHGIPAAKYGRNIVRNADPFGDWELDLSHTTLGQKPYSKNFPNMLLTLHFAGWND